MVGRVRERRTALLVDAAGGVVAVQVGQHDVGDSVGLDAELVREPVDEVRTLGCPGAAQRGVAGCARVDEHQPPSRLDDVHPERQPPPVRARSWVGVEQLRALEDLGVDGRERLGERQEERAFRVEERRDGGAADGHGLRQGLATAQDSLEADRPAVDALEPSDRVTVLELLETELPSVVDLDRNGRRE